MLRLLPLPLLQRMRRRSASVDIIGRRQQVSDLPEYRHLKGERGHYAGDAERAAPRDKRQPRPRRPRHYYGLSEAQLTADERTRGYGELRASNPNPDPDSNPNPNPDPDQAGCGPRAAKRTCSPPTPTRATPGVTCWCTSSPTA